MKKLFFLSILFTVCISAKAQIIKLPPTYTTKQLSDSMRKQRNEFLEFKRKVDSIIAGGVYLTDNDFQIDSITKTATIRQKGDTLIIIRRQN